jgi:23S rRNA (cytosine1962-C5)-methyltransferase
MRVILKPGREKSLLRFHPWIFSGAIHSVEGDPGMGQTVSVWDKQGHQLGYGSFSPHSQIRVRMLSFDPDQLVDQELLHKRILRAAQGRKQFASDTIPAAYRLVNAESDGLPGLVVDRYDTFLVIQILSAGMEFWRATIIQTLHDLFPDCSLYERSDSQVRTKEGLAPQAGHVLGDEPPELVAIQEQAAGFYVDIREGHKTGFYLDQRESRSRVARYASRAEMLNCFCYTGGFGIMSLVWGADRVTQVDASPQALDLAAKNMHLNEIAADRVEHVPGDVFKVLRAYKNQGRTFDMIVLDPPKFAESKAQVPKACRGYKDINLLALQLVRKGGMLFTFSCSGNIDADLFQKVVAGAAMDAGREVQILEHFFQAPDHPTSIFFPEGTYLKGLGLRVY